MKDRVNHISHVLVRAVADVRVDEEEVVLREELERGRAHVRRVVHERRRAVGEEEGARPPAVPLPLGVGAGGHVLDAVVAIRPQVGPPAVERLLHDGRVVVAVVDDDVHARRREPERLHLLRRLRVGV